MGENSMYARSGVNISAGNQAVDLMKSAVSSTYGPEVLAGIGAFGGLYDIQALSRMAHPVLVASTDGVGTKTKVASKLKRWHTIGQDLVNHCINDILVQGAHPLFFLDYVAMSHLEPQQVVDVVGGVAAACRGAGIALLGGETAELPGVYHEGELDLVGTIIGVVDKSQIIDGHTIRTGDVILGLASSGLHTNGYSLARSVVGRYDWSTPLDELGGVSLGDVLLAVHRPYLAPVKTLWNAGITIKGMAHITGGGIVENLPRSLPEGVRAVLHRGQWTEPPIFGFIQKNGSVSDSEMFRVFNMGLGLLIVLDTAQAEQARAALPELTVVGEIVSGAREVQIR